MAASGLQKMGSNEVALGQHRFERLGGVRIPDLGIAGAFRIFLQLLRELPPGFRLGGIFGKVLQLIGILFQV